MESDTKFNIDKLDPREVLAEDKITSNGSANIDVDGYPAPEY